MRIGDRDRNERKPVFPVCRKKHRTFRWKAACRRGAAVLLAGCMILEEGAFALSSYAAEAAAGVDETVYVNLDYYGNPTAVNVVKALSMNGTTEFTDYGTYQEVINMSDRTEPVINGDSVTWSFPEGRRDRFYYQGRMETEQLALPWNFDVSYKLNGVPVNGEDLAGASGLVEIHIAAQPNENALDYYKNNMVLLVAVPADMDSCYSLDAPGSQTQTVGSSSFVVFTALPGEEGDFTVRMGTDSFETIGIVMTMMPGTLKDLERIQDLNDAKETWSDAGDQLYDSADELSASMEAMRGGIGQLMAGLQSAESARQTWRGSKDEILAGNDRALESLSAMADQLNTMIPHIQTAKDAAQVVHESMGDLVDVLGEMRDPMERLSTSLRRLRSHAESASGDLDELTGLMQQLIALDAALSASEQAYITGLGSLAENLNQLEADYLTEMADLATASDAAEAWDGALEQSRQELLEEAMAGAAGGDGTGSASGAEGQEGAGSTSGSAGQGGAGSIPGSGTAAGDVTMDARELMQALITKKGYLEQISVSSRRLSSRMSSLLEDTGDSARRAAQLLEEMDWLIEDLTALRDSLNMYYPDLQQGLDDAAELVSRTSEALQNGTDTLGLVQDTIKRSSDDFDAAARDAIGGSLDLLDKSLGALDATASMRSAGRTMKDTFDEEWNRLEDETRFLSMDPEAKKVSFTSEKNGEPDTLQIVIRTEEISLDKEEELLDTETETEPVSPLVRMWNVLVKMWNAIVEIFKNR